MFLSHLSSDIEVLSVLDRSGSGGLRTFYHIYFFFYIGLSKLRYQTRGPGLLGLFEILVLKNLGVVELRGMWNCFLVWN